MADWLGGRSNRPVASAQPSVGFYDGGVLACMKGAPLVGGHPSLLGQLYQDLMDVEVLQGGTEGELHHRRSETMSESVHDTRDVGPTSTRAHSGAPQPGDLRQRGVEHRDVGIGDIGTGSARATPRSSSSCGPREPRNGTVRYKWAVTCPRTAGSAANVALAKAYFVRVFPFDHTLKPTFHHLITTNLPRGSSHTVVT